MTARVKQTTLITLNLTPKEAYMLKSIVQNAPDEIGKDLSDFYIDLFETLPSFPYLMDSMDN